MPVVSKRDAALFALRWDLRYWRGQYFLPGVDRDRIALELEALQLRIERIERGTG